MYTCTQAPLNTNSPTSGHLNNVNNTQQEISQTCFAVDRSIFYDLDHLYQCMFIACVVTKVTFNRLMEKNITCFNFRSVL